MKKGIVIIVQKKGYKVEKRDLYNVERKLMGETIYKGEEIPKNRRVLVVIVFIQNSRGEFLIQKEASKKVENMVLQVGILKQESLVYKVC